MHVHVVVGVHPLEFFYLIKSHKLLVHSHILCYNKGRREIRATFKLTLFKSRPEETEKDVGWPV